MKKNSTISGCWVANLSEKKVFFQDVAKAFRFEDGELRTAHQIALDQMKWDWADCVGGSMQKGQIRWGSDTLNGKGIKNYDKEKLEQLDLEDTLIDKEFGVHYLEKSMQTPEGRFVHFYENSPDFGTDPEVESQLALVDEERCTKVSFKALAYCQKLEKLPDLDLLLAVASREVGEEQFEENCGAVFTKQLRDLTLAYKEYRESVPKKHKHHLLPDLEEMRKAMLKK